MKNFFRVLNIDVKSSEKEIKKAFKNLALLHHPDKPGGSKEKFFEIQEAYNQALEFLKHKITLDQKRTDNIKGQVFKKIQYPKFLKKDFKCPTCYGKGFILSSFCYGCSGDGKKRTVARLDGVIITHSNICKECNGLGEIPSSPCKTCDGQGDMTREEFEKAILSAQLKYM